MRMIVPVDSVAEYVERNADEMTDCEVCGYRGPLSFFAQEDVRKLRCPKCGESKEIIFVL